MIRKQKQRNNRKSLAGAVLSAILACCLAAGSFAAVFCYAAEQPLFVFDYQGSHIETYVDYSVVDGTVCETHRYFVKNGNLVLVDQKLQPTPRDIFIHFEGGKSYIAILNRSGQLVSLGTEDLIRTLDHFSNRNIASISDNIFSASTTLYITYNDGASVAYDCVTGKLLSGTPSTEKKSISEYVSGYLTDVFDRSTQGFADTSGAMAQSVVTALEGSGASLEDLMSAGLAEDIEQAYQDLGESWNGEVYEPASFTAENTGPSDEGQYLPEAEGTVPAAAPGEASGEPVPYSVGEMPYGEILDSEEYSNLMTVAEGVLNKEQLVELRDLFAKVASGDVSAAEAAGELAFYLPEDTGEEGDAAGEDGESEDSPADAVEVYVYEASESTSASSESSEENTADENPPDAEAAEKDPADGNTAVSSSGIPSDVDPSDVDPAGGIRTVVSTPKPSAPPVQAAAEAPDKPDMNLSGLSLPEMTAAKGSAVPEGTGPRGAGGPEGHPAEQSSGSASAPPERKNTLEKFRESIEQMQAALEEIEKKQSEKEYIQSSFKDKYISVYNAEEKRYDIYSQETVMKKPDELVSESSKLTDMGSAEALNRLLAGEKGSTVQSGFNIFIIIAASIVAAAAILLVIVAKNTRVKKSDK